MREKFNTVKQSEAEMNRDKDGVIRDDEGNIVAGRQRAAIRQARNPYKVNVNHHFDKEMSADLVEEIDHKGKVKWDCYLFAAGAVTPMRVVELGTYDAAYEWACNKGAAITTQFGLDRDNPEEWPFKKGQTINLQSCIETTMNTLISDVRDIATIEYQALQTIMNAPIVFVDDNGNQYEYDGVSISEGKIKLSIKPIRKQ